MPERRFADEVFKVVRKIPRGKVASYGLVGELAGYPRSGRQVGMIMRLGTGLPWWRVIAKDGRLVIGNPEFRREQELRLQMEGIPVVGGRVDYDAFSWKPRRAGTRPRSRARPPR